MNTNLQNTNLSRQVDELINSVSDSGKEYFRLPKNGGFELQGQTAQTIPGTIDSIQPYLLAFVNGKPERLPNVQNDSDIPTGFTRRCDVVIRSGNGQKAILSLSPSSLRPFKNYLVSLTNQGMTPDQVVTEFRTEPRKGDFGSYQVVLCKAVSTTAQAVPVHVQNIPVVQPAPPVTAAPVSVWGN